ncbi:MULTISPECIES: hypothetical protein [unclassified Corallococcus]|uniref:hypothetical protein n=1 Tax=unclassified Corallococcus TaxID=2685029 RepID=UPI001A8D56E9|nr:MULTISPECIES: hypothetical protein [unclassified Corallococcus]MBN9685381.1 hypothetical protein [Corallococcus sp. NCSPR001]WAS83168.1 hypothetical protein O0N60_28085 [Corallococcus sp. NCRR]
MSPATMLPGASSTRWGGRPAQTPAEVEYQRAVVWHAVKREHLAERVAENVVARKALMEAVASVGPHHAWARSCMTDLLTSRAAVNAAHTAVAKADVRIIKALEAWAAVEAHAEATR